MKYTILLALFLGGCVAESIPGGTTYAKYSDGNGRTLIFKSDTDASLQEASMNLAQGTVSLKGLVKNGSNLGGIQGAAYQVMSNNTLQGWLAFLNFAAQAMPFIEKGGGVMVTDPLTGVPTVKAKQ